MRAEKDLSSEALLCRRIAWKDGKRLAWTRAGILLCLLFANSIASAQILDSIEVTRQGDLALIEANFSRPVFYLRHFPPQSGETLQIYLRVPVVPNEPSQREIAVRKSLKGPPIDHLPLQDVTYEGTGVEGPRLIVRFTRPVRYSVEQGRTNRSIKIIVPGHPASAVPKSSGKAPVPAKPSTAVGTLEPSAERPPGGKQSATAAKNYVVTIVPSLTTAPDMVGVKQKLLKAFPKGVVYRVRAVVFGKTIHLVRLGFFLRATKPPPHSKSSHRFTLWPG